jgi:hypothetical protein
LLSRPRPWLEMPFRRREHRRIRRMVNWTTVLWTMVV